MCYSESMFEPRKTFKDPNGTRHHPPHLGTFYQKWEPLGHVPPVTPEKIGDMVVFWRFEASRWGGYQPVAYIDDPKVKGPKWIKYDSWELRTSGLQSMLDYVEKNVKKQHEIDTKNRQREIAKARREKLKADAAELGISVHELKLQRKAEREQKKALNKAKRSMKETQQRIELGKDLVQLKNEVEGILQRIHEDKNLNLSYFNRSLNRINEATYSVRRLIPRKERGGK